MGEGSIVETTFPSDLVQDSVGTEMRLGPSKCDKRRGSNLLDRFWKQFTVDRSK